MSTEMRMLVWSAVLGLVLIGIAALAVTLQRGLPWAAGPRDGVAPPLTGVAGRLYRASANFLETFVFFAVGVLALEILQRHTAQSALGAQLYFWARVAHAPIYALGLPYVRTLIWVVSIVGIVMVLLPLF